MSGDSSDGRRERGVDLLGQVMGDAVDGLEEHIGSSDFGKECATWAAEFAYGTVWSREGLERRMRSATVMGMLIALRQTEELKVHVGIALANGVTVGELEEILYLTVPYVGFPAANSAKIAMKQALADIQNKQAAVSPVPEEK